MNEEGSFKNRSKHDSKSHFQSEIKLEVSFIPICIKSPQTKKIKKHQTLFSYSIELSISQEKSLKLHEQICFNF